MNKSLGRAIWLVVFGLVVATTAREAAAVEKPNIILCMADDQGYGDVGYYGDKRPKTPILDEMSRSGLRFDRFYAAAPVCSPTRGSVLTGRHPNRFACFSWGHTLRPQEITIAEALKQAGYTTGHFGKWHLGSVEATSPVCPGNSGFDEWFSSPNFYENSPLFSHNGKVVETNGESSMVTVEKALGFIRSAQEKESPFLAVIWFGNPHSPHEATEELTALYPDLPPKLQHYFGEITGIDQAMGHLRKELRELGIADNTLLWYTSDNGGQKPGLVGDLKGYKGSLWEGGLRVPTIIEWPARITKPKTTTLPSGTVDIYPTVLDAAGVTIPKQPPLDGQSLLPLIDDDLKQRAAGLGFWVIPAKGRPRHSHRMLVELRNRQEEPTTIPDADADKLVPLDFPEDNPPGDAAWIDADYKLHRRFAKRNQVEYLLYNLKQDVAETNNLAESEPERVARMRTALEAWQKSVIESLKGKDYQQ